MTRLLGLALLLAGCSAPAEDPQAPPATAPSQAMEVPDSIIGEYRVAGIDGAPMDADYGIAVSITADTISYEPRCLGFAWTYTLSEGRIAVARDPRHGPHRAEDGSTVTCLPAVGPESRALALAFDAAEQVRRTPENAIEFSGKGHSVTLFSQ